MTRKNNFDTEERLIAHSKRSDPHNKLEWRRNPWTDLCWVIAIIVMLLWPWLFFAEVQSRNGIQLEDIFWAELVTAFPQQINFFITFLGTIVRIIVGLLFSNAVLRFWQECKPQKSLKFFQLSMISGFKSQKLPWGPIELWDLFRTQKWLRVVLVAACWATFILVPSSTTSLLTPVPFDKYLALNETELDFSSTAPDCLDWLDTNAFLYNNDTCGYMTYNNARFTTCLVENQLEDVLESGRANMLSFISEHYSESLFSQINAEFLGPIGGVLPLGPNGVSVFNTVPFPHLQGSFSNYRYNLSNQGIDLNVTCNHASQSPVVISGIPGDTNNLLLQYNGTCDEPGEVDILDASQPFTVLNSNNTLTFWACKSTPSEANSPSYSIYLRGSGSDYEETIGNITCNISQIQSTIIPVMYYWLQGYFNVSAAEPFSPGSKTIFPNITDKSVISLGGLVQEGQSQAGNLLAESVLTFEEKFPNSPAYGRDRYLQLNEAMIQGVIEYLVTYSRVVYNLYSGTTDKAPPSCVRQVNGTISYQVMGWVANKYHIGFLMPLTIVNLTSLVLMICAMLGPVTSRGYDGSNDPDHAEESFALVDLHTSKHWDKPGWDDYVTVTYCHPEPDNGNNGDDEDDRDHP